MALTFSAPTGQLLSAKVGLDDVVTTYSAAKAVYGWLGGMDGVGLLISKIPSAFSRKPQELQLEKNLQLLPVASCVLIGTGLVLANIDNAHESFGGDIRTQIIGSTICAIAHECSPEIAVELFADHLMPHLFDVFGALGDALRDQLMTDTNLQVILNEGAARGLTDLFSQRILQLDLPLQNTIWRRSQLSQQENNDELVHQSQMVGGLLKWIAQDQHSEYRTRSASVARVAACLQAIGYNIGQIEKWDGVGPPPTVMTSKALILVLGGSTPTDPFLLESFPTLTGTAVIHYQFRTVGALLLSALGGTCQSFPEVFQAYFESVFEYISTHLNAALENPQEPKPLTVKFQWTPCMAGTVPVARRLAAIYFPKSADFVAPCYNSIDSVATLEAVTAHLDAQLLDDVGVPEEVAHFRVITASIAMSVASRFAPKGFANIRHSSKLDLCFDFWLKQVCKVIDQTQGGTVELHKVIGVLAAVHAGQSPVSIEHSNNSIIAWRQGIYAIAPSLLLSMDPDEDTVQLQCIDRFWANVKVRQDGSIRSDMVSSVLCKSEFIESPSATAEASSAVERLDQPWLGPPAPATPDISLYISIGTPQRFGGTDLCFTARIEGEIVGNVGIVDVLRTLLLSRTATEEQPQQQCPGHEAPSSLQVLNVKSSRWAQDRYLKPVSRRGYTYVAVKDDACWAIFLAGQTIWSRGRIVFKCAECIAARTKAPAVLIGFH